MSVAIPFPILRSRVLQAYRGLPGCCCGCKGRHHYRAATVASGGRWRGYAVDPDEVSEQDVSDILQIVNSAAAGSVPDSRLTIDVNGEWASVDGDDRVLIVYLLPGGESIPDAVEAGPAFA